MVTFRGTNTGELIKLSCSEPDGKLNVSRKQQCQISLFV